MCVILSATVTLCCFFMPKMYLVLLHPEKIARGSPGEKTGGAQQRSTSGGNQAHNAAVSSMVSTREARQTDSKTQMRDSEDF